MLGDRHVLGKGTVATVVVTRDAEHLAIVAEVYIPHATEPAFAAGYGGIEGNAITHVNRMDIYPGLRHDASSFMPHDEWWDAAAGTAVKTMNIASTYAAGFHLDKDILRTEFGLWDIPHLKISNVFEYESSHNAKDNL
jgi:hypothetical protein